MSTNPDEAETGFRLTIEPATRQRGPRFDDQPTRQRVLLAGMDCLPGQLDLFLTDGTETDPSGEGV